MLSTWLPKLCCRLWRPWVLLWPVSDCKEVFFCPQWSFRCQVWKRRCCWFLVGLFRRHFPLFAWPSFRIGFLLWFECFPDFPCCLWSPAKLGGSWMECYNRIRGRLFGARVGFWRFFPVFKIPQIPWNSVRKEPKLDTEKQYRNFKRFFLLLGPRNISCLYTVLILMEFLSLLLGLRPLWRIFLSKALPLWSKESQNWFPRLVGSWAV